MALPLFRRYRETTILPVGLVIAVAALGIGLGAEAAGVFLVFVGLYTVAESLFLPSADTGRIARIARRGSESTYFGLSDLSGALGGGARPLCRQLADPEQSPRTAWWVFLAVGVADWPAFWRRGGCWTGAALNRCPRADRVPHLTRDPEIDMQEQEQDPPRPTRTCARRSYAPAAT